MPPFFLGGLFGGAAVHGGLTRGVLSLGAVVVGPARVEVSGMQFNEALQARVVPPGFIYGVGAPGGRGDAGARHPLRCGIWWHTPGF